MTNPNTMQLNILITHNATRHNTVHPCCVEYFVNQEKDRKLDRMCAVSCHVAQGQKQIYNLSVGPLITFSCQAGGDMVVWSNIRALGVMGA